MTRLQRYPSYREVSTTLLREIPETWNAVPMRRLGRVVNGGTPTVDSENWGGEIPFITPPDLRPVIGGELMTTERHLTPAGLAAGSSLVPAGSVMVSIRAPIGYVARSTVASAFNQGVRALVPSEDTNARFLTYALLAAAPALQAEGRGTTFMEVSAAQFAAFELPIPSMEEQKVIVAYLDRETARIGSLIEKQQRLVRTLRERIDSVWHTSFSSDVGKRLTSIRRVLTPLQRPAVAGLGVVTAYRDGTVTLRSNRRDDGYTFSDSETGYQEVRPGDLVFHALDGFAGAVGICDSRGNATPVYHVCEPIAGDDAEYLAMLLRYLGLTGFLATQAPSVRQRSVDFRNWETFGRVPLALPHPQEQRAIAAAFREQVAGIDALIVKAERFIELARERRSALISAAVTGRVDVRGVA